MSALRLVALLKFQVNVRPLILKTVSGGCILTRGIIGSEIKSGAHFHLAQWRGLTSVTMIGYRRPHSP